MSEATAAADDVLDHEGLARRRFRKNRIRRKFEHQHGVVAVVVVVVVVR